MGVMELYLDESGIHGDSPVCVVGGFWGGYRKFRELEKQWADIVSCLPNGDFHAKQFFGRDELGKRVGPYKDWSDDQASKFAIKLTKAVRQSGVKPVRSFMDRKEFFSRSVDERVWLTLGRHNDAKWNMTGSPISDHSPYYTPFASCLTDYFDMNARSGLVLNTFFDQNKAIESHALEMYLLFQETHPQWNKNYGPLVPVSRLKVKLVQAADMLAYLTYDQLTAMSEECRLVLRLILGPKARIFAFNKQGIDAALEGFKPPRRGITDGNPSLARAEQKRISKMVAKR